MSSNLTLDVAVSAFPVFLLVYLILKSRPLPAAKSLPVAAATLYLLRLSYFSSDPTLTHAVLINGFLTAFTPLLIVAGAILLFKTMERSGAMATTRQWLNTLTNNRVGQLMLVGWSFSFLVEGISGFGTPAALAAPLLVGLGFPALPVAVFCLILNSVPVSFGAVGMPTWFGFGELSLNPSTLQDVGLKTALIHSGAALVVPLLALRVVVPSKEIRENIRFIYLSILASVLPYVVVARFNVEFPSVVGGFLGLAGTVFLAKRNIGMSGSAAKKHSSEKFGGPRLIKALFPFWGTILILLVTRVPFFGFNRWLNAGEPSWKVSLGSLGDLAISPALVVELRNILGTEIAWRHAVLYVPSVIPFLLISALCAVLFKIPRAAIVTTWEESYQQVVRALGAFFGAMIFAKLFMMGGETSCVIILGRALSGWLGQAWTFASAYLGALGSFFSGSNTVSNLTFGGVQYAVAQTLGLNETTILALQSVGGAMGNMVCLHNIVAVCSILGLQHQEGAVLKKTVGPVLIYGALAALISLSF